MINKIVYIGSIVLYGFGMIYHELKKELKKYINY